MCVLEVGRGANAQRACFSVCAGPGQQAPTGQQAPDPELVTFHSGVLGYVLRGG